MIIILTMSSIDDKMIGRNVRNLRGNMTMEMLAAKMRDLGHKWTKITVHNIETGDRQLRMKEAVDLAECVGADAASVVSDLVVSQNAVAMNRALTEAVRARRTFLQGSRILLNANEKLRKVGTECDAMDENEKIIRQRCEDELQLEKQLVEIAEKLDELAKALRIDEDSETLAFNPF